jgi:hypothetical protein
MPLRLLKLFLGLSTFAWGISAGTVFAGTFPAKDVTTAWFADGKFIEESESQRMTNDFGGRLDFTDDPFFILKWQTNWTSISSIKRLEPVYIVLFIADKNDVPEPGVVYEITIKFPNGMVCSRFTNQPVVIQNISPMTRSPDLKPTLRLSGRATVFQTDLPDPTGMYTVEVELRDRLRKTSVTLTKQLNVIK